MRRKEDIVEAKNERDGPLLTSFVSYQLPREFGPLAPRGESRLCSERDKGEHRVHRQKPISYRFDTQQPLSFGTLPIEFP